MITTNDIKQLINLTVLRFKPALIQAMNATGNSVSVTISDNELADRTWDVFVKTGWNGLQQVIGRVPLDKSKLTPAEQNALIRIFSLPVNPSVKCGFAHPLDCLTGAINYVGDLVGGTSTSITNPIIQQQTSSSALPTWAIIATVVGGLAGIMIFRKFTAVVVAIIVIVMGVFLYGIFVKNTSTTVSGGGTTTTSSGGIGSALFSWLGL